MELEADTVVDRYRVVEVLGRGGMAIVYRVRHEFLGSTHALKVVLSPRAATRERLMQEGRAQSQLRHRHIVAVTDVISVLGAPGLVLEFIDGPNLEQLLAGEPLSLPQADSLARGLLAGMAAAHQLGIVHRDLKPANVLLAWEEDSWIPKIADFGVAKVLDEERFHRTRTGVGLGTPMYMAPEQTVDASRVDQRADVFALGAILYELVTGERAFHGGDLVELFSQIRSCSFQPVGELRPDVPERMVRAIEGALVADPEERIASSEELLAVWSDGTPAPTGLGWPQPERTLLALQPSGSGSYDAATFDGSLTSLTPPPVSSDSTGTGSRLTRSSTAPAPSNATTSASTLVPDGLDVSSTTIAPDETVALAPTSVPAPVRRRWLPMAGAAIALLALGAGALVFWPEPGEVVHFEGEDRGVYERGWEDLLDGELVSAERHFTRLARSQEPMAWVLLAMARAAQGQGGPAHVAVWSAIDAAEESEAPGLEGIEAVARARRKGWSRTAMQALIDEHDDLPTLWLSTWNLPRGEEDFGEIVVKRMRQAHPDRVFPTLHAVGLALARGDREQARAHVEQGLQRFEDHPVLLMQLGELAVAEGELEQARTALTAALQFAPGLYGARHRLAEVSLLLGDEEATRALVTASMAPSEPVGQRTSFSRRFGLALAGMGRVREANEQFRAGAAVAEAANDHLTRGSVLGMIPLIALDAERFDEARAGTQELLDFSATHPEIPEGERAAMSRSLLEARAFIVAREGDLEAAREHVERMKRVEGVRASAIEWVERDIAAHEGDVDALEGLFEHAQPGCNGRWEKARALALAGADEAAREHVTSLLDDGVCGPIGAERWANALALELAARLDPERRDEHLASFHRVWPDPDVDLPVVQRVLQLEAR